jgi:hypothetical protein
MKTIRESLLALVFLIFWMVLLPVAGLFAATLVVYDGVTHHSHSAIKAEATVTT